MPEPSRAPSRAELEEGRPPPGAEARRPPLPRQGLVGGGWPLGVPAGIPRTAELALGGVGPAGAPVRAVPLSVTQALGHALLTW